MFAKRLERSLVHLAVFALIYGFLLSYFTPSFLFSSTVTTGGDTASHYLTADYLINTLLPKYQIIGWMPGNYAGFPLFQFYFPFPFLIMAALNWFMPLQIAFKLVTVLGIFLLPLCAFFCLRLLGFRFPAPIIGAIFSLPFLFMEANSMWGGNIPSTLAGEFTYSIGFALLILYLGLFSRGLAENKYAVLNAVLLSVIGLSHGYTLLFGVFVTTFFLFTTERFLEKAWYTLKVNGIAFLLLGFWMIQLLWFMPYTTRFTFVWILKGLSQVFPPILWPVIALALAGVVFNTIRAIRHRNSPVEIPPSPLYEKGGQGDDSLSPFRKGGLRGISAGPGMTPSSIVTQSPGEANSGNRSTNGRAFLWFVCLLATAFYLVAYNINVVDVRFIPMIQFSLMLLGAVGLRDLTSRLGGLSLVPLFVGVITVVLVNSQIGYIPNWIAWNYSGFEKKGVWPAYKAVNDCLKGTCADPRVVYEHDPKQQAAGTIRAFEMLPYFSGRSTLEGLYIQSTVTSPFVFYLQSEISEKPSTPLTDYNYSRVNLERGIKHLELFNVSHLIVVTKELREGLSKCDEVLREAYFPPYTIYRLKNNGNRYVSVLETEPALLITKDWRQEAFQWFRKSDLKTFVAFKEKLEPEDTRRFHKIVRGRLSDEVLHPASVQPAALVKEIVRPEEILIETRNVGRPHLVRVSYHPNWHVEGADEIYPVSPSFMLIFPTKERVRLYFGPSFPNYLGYALSLLGLLTIIGYCVWPKQLGRFESRILDFAGRLAGERFSDVTLKKRLFWLVGIFMVCLVAGSLLFARPHDATTTLRKGFSYYEAGDYAAAREVFRKGMQAFPYSPVIDQTAFQYAVTYFKEEQWAEALAAFEQMAAEYPESRRYTEVLFHIGLCKLRLNRPEEARSIFRQIVEEFPGDRWAAYAKQELKRLSSK